MHKDMNIDNLSLAPPVGGGDWRCWQPNISIHGPIGLILQHLDYNATACDKFLLCTIMAKLVSHLLLAHGNMSNKCPINFLIAVERHMHVMKQIRSHFGSSFSAQSQLSFVCFVWVRLVSNKPRQLKQVQSKTVSLHNRNCSKQTKRTFNA